jgi:Tol biopolymer transport system component
MRTETSGRADHLDHDVVPADQVIVVRRGSLLRGTLCLLAVAAGISVPRAARSQTAANGLPSVSPDGRRIAFVGRRGGRDRLFVIDIDGTHEREVKGASTDARMPRWSTTGELLFSGAGADTGKVFAVNIDTGKPRLVVSVAGRSPNLSPDGTRVLYLVGPWTSTALVVVDTDGSNARTLAGGRTTAWNGTWSPEGRRVAYTYGDSSHVLQVHVVGVDGRGDQAVTHTTADQGSAQMPAWSPEGRRLALQVNHAQTHSSEIWIVDLSNGGVHRLSRPDARFLDETPSWFPDGTRLAFQSNRTGSMEVWVMNSDGSSPRQVTGRSGT